MQIPSWLTSIIGLIPKQDPVVETPAGLAHISDPVPVAESSSPPACGWSKDLKDCHAKIREAFPAVEEEFKQAHPDCSLKVDYTWRGKELQFQLYQKGRELQNGKWVVVDQGKVVTDKDGTKISHHQVYPAQAADIYIVRDGKIIWTDHDLYEELGNIWQNHGLVSGAVWIYKWHDDPHVQVDYKIV